MDPVWDSTQDLRDGDIVCKPVASHSTTEVMKYVRFIVLDECLKLLYKPLVI